MGGYGILRHMKKLFFIVFMGVCAAAQAAEFDVCGDFASEIGKNGLPKGWTFHAWKGYLPQPTVSVTEGDAKGTRALCVKDVRGTDGAAKAVPARNAIPKPAHIFLIASLLSFLPSSVPLARNSASEGR